MTNIDDELDKLIELHTIDIAYAARRQKTGTLPLEREAFKVAIKQLFKITGDTSDGYHTFNELYEYRMLYNAALFNQWHKDRGQFTLDVKNLCKSWKHSDGELCFGGGWFVVTAQLPTGQITNHYEAKDWDLFQIPEVPTAPEWDGHTPQDVAKRLREFLSTKPEQGDK